MDELLRTVAEEVVRTLNGHRPLSVVNPEVDGQARGLLKKVEQESGSP
jgi:hypothetical protein